MTRATVTAHGTTVPALGFGTWQLEPDVAERCVRDALDIGYRHIDTAAMYGNEEAVGAAIRDHAVDRDELFLTTKVQPQHAKHDDLLVAAQDSLRRLGLDHVDLLLIHWPTDVAPIEETIEALAEAQSRGRTRTIGVSNYTADQVQTAAKVAPVITNQVEYHPLLSQEAVLQACRDAGMFVTAYSPLANGLVMKDPVLGEIASEIGCGPAEVALRWLLDQDDVAAIPRSSDRDHIAANAQAGTITLTDDQRQRIDELTADRRRQIDPPSAPDWDEV